MGGLEGVFPIFCLILILVVLPRTCHSWWWCGGVVVWLHSFDAFTTGNPLVGTTILGISIGTGFGFWGSKGADQFI